jgi:2-polyprenyl-3-methyl-5-hydroxy-6-metoxy-1,4-benzoquinol methylase
MKVLVAIANYGMKNDVYVRRVIDEYRRMSYDIDIIVLSNVPKDIGADIEVRVGFPGKNPWNLPFPHKEIFAKRVKDYDLFIYSEDDTLITQRNIEAFLNATAVLPENEIAGFLRFEEVYDGGSICMSIPEIHASYHWSPKSVKSFGKYTFAHFTNEHSACYILTKQQLQKAIESGGFLVAPHEGDYDLLCSAATDPYTQCGFTRMICISHIEEFLLHHLPNVYVGKLGIDRSELQLQINALLAINAGTASRSELLPEAANPQLNISRWDKQYYGKCEDDVLASIPDYTKNVLSVGCGCGVTEARLVQKGIRVVGIPLDSIIAESAKSRGVEVLCPDFERAREILGNTKFDCILFVDLLGHLRDPVEVLSGFAEFMRDKSCAIITMPNFSYMRYVCEMFQVYRRKETFDKAHLHFTTPKMARKWFTQSELRVVSTKYKIENRFKKFRDLPLGPLRKYFAPEVLFVAKKYLQ